MLSLLMLFVVAVALVGGCVQTQTFSYPYPGNARRSMTIMISYNQPFKDVVRVIIDGGLIFEKSLTMDPEKTNGWVLMTGQFEGEPVVLSCSRAQDDLKTMICDFSIGSGAHCNVTLK